MRPGQSRTGSSKNRDSTDTEQDRLGNGDIVHQETDPGTEECVVGVFPVASRVIGTAGVEDFFLYQPDFVGGKVAIFHLGAGVTHHSFSGIDIVEKFAADDFFTCGAEFYILMGADNFGINVVVDGVGIN